VESGEVMVMGVSWNSETKHLEDDRFRAEPFKMDDIYCAIARETGLKQAFVRHILRMFMDSIVDVMAVEGRLQMTKFGVFEVRKKRAHRMINPQTGEYLIVPEHNRMVFRACEAANKKIQALIL